MGHTYKCLSNDLKNSVLWLLTCVAGFHSYGVKASTSINLKQMILRAAVSDHTSFSPIQMCYKSSRWLISF